jgi:LAS superfamily LD-carboxypeptidase LdcB
MFGCLLNAGTLKLDLQLDGVLPRLTPGPMGTNGDAASRTAKRLHSPAASSVTTEVVGETKEFTEFKAKVLAEETAMRTRRGLKQLKAVPEEDLVIVEGNRKMRKEAAAKLKLLLSQARADLKAEQDALGKLPAVEQQAARTAASVKGEVAVDDVKRIWVQSAYRDFKYDENLWHKYFKRKYYPATKVAREKLEGGEHGDAAVKYLAKYISGKKAPPGFSNHSDGRAVDFGTQEGSTVLVGEVELNKRWKKAWLYKWLVNNAVKYGFKPLSTEAWHWDFSS